MVLYPLFTECRAFSYHQDEAAGMMGAIIFPYHTPCRCHVFNSHQDDVGRDHVLLRHYPYPLPHPPSHPRKDVLVMDVAGICRDLFRLLIIIIMKYLSKREHHKSDAGRSVHKSSVCWVLCTETKCMLGALYRNQVYAGCSVQKSSVCTVFCTEIKCMLGVLYRNQVYAGCSVQKSSVCTVLCTEIKCNMQTETPQAENNSSDYKQLKPHKA